MHDRHHTLLDGEKVLIRRLLPEDAALYPDFLAEVTAEDLRLRFFAPMRAVSPELIDKLIHYDPAHAMAFIAIDEQNGRMLGVVILAGACDALAMFPEGKARAALIEAARFAVSRGY